MQITIGAKTFDAEPYLINQNSRKQATDLSVFDPYEYDGSAFGYDPRRRSITAVDYRLIQAERLKIYEYNCKTRRGDTFDLDANGNLVLHPVIYYIVQKKPRYSGPKQHPGWDLKPKNAKTLADDFRNATGLPTKLGMSDPNVAVDLAIRKLGGASRIRPTWKKKANSLIPDVSFVVYVDVDYAYFRLKFGDPDAGEFVIIGLPRLVTPVLTITYVCRAETVGDIKKVGEDKAKKPISIGLPSKFPDAVELRKAYAKALAEQAEALAKKKAQSKVDRMKAEKERLERSLEWTKKRLEELQEKLEGG